ncbi:MAG: hypothetical protein O3C40_35775 [Planctomycetota bacterium]|nr:hypothetical protein [Planctomycetota bacterium]
MHTITLRRRDPIALVIATYQPNRLSSDLLRVALRSFERFHHAGSAAWVVDVDSPEHPERVEPAEFPNVNFVVTDDEPLLQSEASREMKRKGLPPPVTVPKSMALLWK